MYYEYGCPLEDSGLCAYLMWRNQLYVQLPPSIGAIWGEAYFPGHISPILSITSLLSKVIDVSMIDFSAYYHGISHGLLALSMFFIFHRLYKLTSVFEITLAFFLSLIFSFNGISVASLYYPHYEMLFVPIAILFLALLVQKKPLLALPFFLISLSVRECSGFHLFSILFFLVITDLIKNKTIYRPYLVYTILAFSYGVIAVIAKKLLYVGGVDNFNNFYIGNPMYSHLSWGLIKERASFIVYNRGYFYGPIVTILIWSIISKRFYLLFGILALLPWFLFNFLAVSTWPPGLYFYYGIFYLLIFFWPLLAVKVVQGENITQDTKNELFKWYSIIVLASVVLNNPFDFKKFMVEPGVSQKHTFQRLQSSLTSNLSQLGNVVVDGQVASLAPGSFTKNQILYLRNTPVEERKKFFGYLDPRIPELQPVDSVMFYNYHANNGLVQFYVLLSYLPYMYRIVGTNVYLASNKKTSELSSFSSILVPVPYHPGYAKQQYISPVFKNAYYRKDVKRGPNSFEVYAKSPPGIAVYSNPIRLPKGQYCIQFDLEPTVPANPDKPVLTIDVTSQGATQVFIKKDFLYADLKGSSKKEIKIYFNVDKNLPHALISVRFWHYQNAGFILKDPRITSVSFHEEQSTIP